MGEVGRWDPGLFERFRAAAPGGEHRRRLLGELLRVNEPLIKILVAQIGGRQPSEKIQRTMRNHLRLPGAEDLEWEEALNIGRFAFTKAMDRFDPKEGKISWYLKLKIFYELQCAVGQASMVRVERGHRAPGLEYLDDELGKVTHDHLERLTHDQEEPELEELAELEEGEEVHLEPPEPLPAHVRLALEIMLEDHCHFAASARAMASAVRGRYRGLADEHGELVVRNVLSIALRAHGVRASTMRVPWWPKPIPSFLGVSLQNPGEVGS